MARKKASIKAPSDSIGAQLSMARKRDVKKCKNPECAKEFEGLTITDYCSDECRFKAAYLRRKGRAAARSPREIGRKIPRHQDQLLVLINLELKNQFIAACEVYGESRSIVMREMIRGFIESQGETP